MPQISADYIRALDQLVDFNDVPPTVQAILWNCIPSELGSPGVIGPVEFAKFKREHPDEMEKIIKSIEDLRLGPPIDGRSFDFSTLESTIENGNWWHLGMEPCGYMDVTGRKIPSSEVHNFPNAQPVFSVFVSEATTGKSRHMEESKGLPNSNFVLLVLQRAIIRPLPPFEPGLPCGIFLGFALNQHIPRLRSFMGNLPGDIELLTQTREEHEKIKEQMDDHFRSSLPVLMSKAEEEKAKGNAAYAAKNQEAALKAYEKAINELENVVKVLDPSPEDKKKAKKLMAMCWANQSATYLYLGRPDKDALTMALKCGLNSEYADPDYPKGYVRQASALMLLQRKPEAMAALIRGLQRKELTNNNGLVDMLMDIFTEGKFNKGHGGEKFKKTESVFRQWVLDTLVNNPKGMGGRSTDSMAEDLFGKIAAEGGVVPEHRK